MDEPQLQAQVAHDKVIVRWQGRIVATLTGKRAEQVKVAVAAGDEAALHLLLARLTGNFKRGNER